MLALRMKLIMAIVAWLATRFMRRLCIPALVIAIVLEILLAAVHSAMSRKEQKRDSEMPQHGVQRVQVD